MDFSIWPEAIMKVITRRVYCAGNIGTSEIREQQCCVQSAFFEKVKGRNHAVTRRNLAVIEGRKQVKEEKNQGRGQDDLRYVNALAGSIMLQI